MFFIVDSGSIKNYTLKEFKQTQPLHATRESAAADSATDGLDVMQPGVGKSKAGRRFSRQYQAVEKAEDQDDDTPLMPVERIMSHPVVFLEDTRTMQDAIRVITDSRFRHLPIVDHTLKLQGVISDRHILKALTSYQSTTYLNASVKDYMVSKILTARPKTSVLEVAYIMFELNIGSMPIIDEDNHILGIVTRSDIGRAFVMISHLDIER